MKTLVIADNDELVENIKNSLEKRGMDAIVYRWLLKALDNLEEISPDLIIISAFEYPRHWKTLVQFCHSGITGKIPVCILYRQQEISEEELKKERELGIYGVFYDSESSQLDELLASLYAPSADSSDFIADTASEIKESSERKSALSNELEDCRIPSVNDILNCKTEKTYIPTVDNLFIFADYPDEAVAEPSAETSDIEEPVESIAAEKPASSPMPEAEEKAPELSTLPETAALESTQIPSVDNLLQKRTDFPTVDTLIQDFQPSLSTLESTVIPSVDFIFEKTGAGKRKHSLLAKIQELYG